MQLSTCRTMVTFCSNRTKPTLLAHIGQRLFLFFNTLYSESGMGGYGVTWSNIGLKYLDGRTW